MTNDEFDQFIADLCVECGIMDNRVGRDLYNGLFRFIVKTVKRNNFIELPNIGTFRKTKNKHENIVRYNVNRGTRENVFSESYVKFKIDKRLKIQCRDY